jgi:hypothetical protein
MSHSELFKRSLEAEYQITDYNACHYKGCDNVGWFPHSYLLPKRFLKILGIFSWLMPLLIPFWALLVLPIFLVKDCVGLVWQKRVIRQPNNSSGLLSRFFLGASTTETLQSVSRVETLPKTYLYLPWRQFPDDLPKSMRPLSLIDIITMRDLYRAVWVAWLEVIKLAMRPSSWGLVLYAYTSFRWFVVLFALLEKKPKEVWISNHYDRWAILLDGIDLDKKVMVQHGDLVMKSAIKNSFVIFGPET